MTPLRIAAVTGVVFGGLTILPGSLALFADLDMGAAVTFVLWFSFCAGFVYVLAGAGLWMGQSWAAWLALGLLAAPCVTALTFAMTVFGGQAFEPRTAVALAVGGAVWAWIAYVSRRLLRTLA